MNIYESIVIFDSSLSDEEAEGGEEAAEGAAE